MAIDDNVLPTTSGPRRRIGCALIRTRTYALHVRVEPYLDATTLPDTVAALATQLVLVPRHVVLETGRLRGNIESHALAVGSVAALVRRAGIELRIVAPDGVSLERLFQVGILPADGLFRSVDAAVHGRA